MRTSYLGGPFFSNQLWLLNKVVDYNYSIVQPISLQHSENTAALFCCARTNAAKALIHLTLRAGWSYALYMKKDDALQQRIDAFKVALGCHSRERNKL